MMEEISLRFFFLWTVSVGILSCLISSQQLTTTDQKFFNWLGFYSSSQWKIILCCVEDCSKYSGCVLYLNKQNQVKNLSTYMARLRCSFENPLDQVKLIKMWTVQPTCFECSFQKDARFIIWWKPQNNNCFANFYLNPQENVWNSAGQFKVWRIIMWWRLSLECLVPCPGSVSMSTWGSGTVVSFIETCCVSLPHSQYTIRHSTHAAHSACCWYFFANWSELMSETCTPDFSAAS